MSRRSRHQAVWSAKAIIERAQERFNLQLQKLISDTAYGTELETDAEMSGMPKIPETASI
jgi:hypothetical protein